MGLNHALHRIFDHCEWSRCKKNAVLKISIFELQKLENCTSRLCPSPLGTPPPQHANRVKNTHKVYDMLYIGYFIIVNGQNIKKKKNFHF